MSSTGCRSAFSSWRGLLGSLGLLTGAALSAACAAPVPAPAETVAEAPQPKLNQFEADVPFGGRFPTRVIARDAQRRWLVACQVRDDTDGNGVLGALEEYNWPHGDDLSPFLFLPGAVPIRFDGFLGHEEEGRLVLVSRGHRVLLVDTNTGDQQWLKGTAHELGHAGTFNVRRFCEQRALDATDPLVPDEDGMVALAQRPLSGSVEALTIQLEDHLVAHDLEPTIPRSPLVWTRLGEQPSSYGARVAPTRTRGSTDVLGIVSHQDLPFRFARPPRHTSFLNGDGSSTPLDDARRQFCRKDQKLWREWSDARGDDLDFARALGWDCDRSCQEPERCWTTCDLAEALLTEAAKYEGEEKGQRQNQAGELLVHCEDQDRLATIVSRTTLPARTRVQLWLASEKPFDARVRRALREMVEEIDSGSEQDSGAWRRTLRAVVKRPDEAVVSPLLSLDRQFPRLELFEYFDCSPHRRLRQRHDQLTRFGTGCGEPDADAKDLPMANTPVDCQQASSLHSLRDCLLDRATANWTEAQAWEAGLAPDRRELLLETGQSSVLRHFESAAEARKHLSSLGFSLREGGATLGSLLSDEHLIELRWVDPEDDRSVDQIVHHALGRHVTLFDGVRVEPFWRRLDQGRKRPFGLNAFFDGKRITVDIELIVRDALAHGEADLHSGLLLWNAAFRFLNAIARERGNDLRFVALERTGHSRFNVLAAPEASIRELHRAGLLTLNPLRGYSLPRTATE